MLPQGKPGINACSSPTLCGNVGSRVSFSLRNATPLGLTTVAAIPERSPRRRSRTSAAALPTRRPSRPAMICRARRWRTRKSFSTARRSRGEWMSWTAGLRGFRQADETRRVGRAWRKLLFYYTLGSDRALWPAGGRRERRLITHDKGYYHSYISRSSCRGSYSNGAKSHVKGRSWDRLASQNLGRPRSCDSFSVQRQVKGPQDLGCGVEVNGTALVQHCQRRHPDGD